MQSSLDLAENRRQGAEVCKIHLFAVGFQERPILCRLFLGGRPAQGLMQQRHYRAVAEGELGIIDSAAQMVDGSLVKQRCRKLPLQRSADIVPVFRFVWIGQPHGDENQLLPTHKKNAAKGFCEAQNAAGIQTAQIEDGFSAGKSRRVLVADSRNAGLLG